MVTSSLDAPLGVLGFEIEEVSPERVRGRLAVTERCCQPFKVLHGGVSALVAEGIASIGAHMASGFQRVAGIHLSIHHLKAAELGEVVLAEATPISKGRTIQVWEVKLRKRNNKASPQPHDRDRDRDRDRHDHDDPDLTLVSSSRVTLICNLPIPSHAKEAANALINYSSSSSKL